MLGVPALPDLDDLPEHAALLHRIVDRFGGDARVEALVLGGSLAQGEGDAWSDIDLYVVVTERDFADVFAERTMAAASVGRPLAQFTVPGVGGGSTDQIVLYDNFVKLDLMYYRASEVGPHHKWAKALVLKDVHGLMGDVQQRSRSLEPVALSDEELLALDQQFWVWCWYALGKIRRGERWAALDALNEIRIAAVVPLLLAIRQQHHERYRRLEAKLGDAEATLAPTVASLERDSQLAALRQEVALFTTARASLMGPRGLAVNETAKTALQSALA